MLRGLMSDAEWAFFAPFLIENRTQGGRRPLDHRRVLDGVLYVTRTGVPWRDLPPEFGNWNSVHRQYRRWTEAGVWDVMLAALSDSGASDNTLQMIDSTIVRVHQHGAGGRGDSEKLYRPFARWAHDQGSYQSECGRVGGRLPRDARPGFRHDGLRRSHGGGRATARGDARRQGL